MVLGLRGTTIYESVNAEVGVAGKPRRRVESALRENREWSLSLFLGVRLASRGRILLMERLDLSSLVLTDESRRSY